MIYVKGLKELAQALQTIPVKLERNVMRGAMYAGAAVLRDEARANVPVSAPSTNGRKKYGGYAGALRDSFRVGTRSKHKIITAYVHAGGKKRADVFYATWVERGTKAHWIDSKSGWLNINGQRVKAPVLHPGARAHPFMRPALDSGSGRATIAIANYIKNRLATKHGLDMSGISVDEES